MKCMPCYFPHITINRQIYNPSHVILKLQNVLLYVQFATSKRKLDIQYNKVAIRVATRVAEQFKTYGLEMAFETVLESIEDLEKHQFQIETQPSTKSPRQNKILAVAIEKYAKP